MQFVSYIQHQSPVLINVRFPMPVVSDVLNSDASPVMHRPLWSHPSVWPNTVAEPRPDLVPERSVISEKVGRGPASVTLVDLRSRSVPIRNSREQRGVPCVCVLGPFRCGSLRRHFAPLCASCHSRPSLYQCHCRGAPPTVAHGRELSAPRLLIDSLRHLR